MPDLIHTEFGWFCFKAIPKKEHIAAEILTREAQIETFCPRISYLKKTRRGIVKFIEPLFPGYLFIHADLQSDYRRIKSTNGVRDVVAFGERVPPVPDHFISDLRARMTTDNLRIIQPPAFQPGESVVITEGPFKNWHAIVTGQIDARQRVGLLLDFLGRQLNIRIESASLLPDHYVPKERVWVED